MEQITIAGHSFSVPLRYEEGHELTAGEAAALNQTYHENLRNNFAKKVKDAAGNGKLNVSELQSELDAYAESYAFGVRTASSGGGVTRDPIMKEAMNIARGMINTALQKKNAERKRAGQPAVSVDAAVKTAKAKQLVETRPEIMELARTRVAEAQAAASDDLSDFINDMPVKDAA
jgi:hypothetical protein